MSEKTLQIFLLLGLFWWMSMAIQYYFDRRAGRQAKLITNRFEPDDPRYYKLLGDLLATVLFCAAVFGIAILVKRLIFS